MDAASRSRGADQLRKAPIGDSPSGLDNSMDQGISHTGKMNVSSMGVVEAVMTNSPNGAAKQLQSLGANRLNSNLQPFNTYAQPEQLPLYSGYGNTGGAWGSYSQYYTTADGFHLPPVVYADNSYVYHSNYGFNPEVGYGQYSPIAAPVPSIMVDGQLYPSQQFAVSPSFFPPHPVNASSSLPISHAEGVASENNGDHFPYAPGVSFLVPYGSFGAGDMSSGSPASSTLTAAAAYPAQLMGILGTYQQNSGQVPFHGYEFPSNLSSGIYQHGESQQMSTLGNSVSNSENSFWGGQASHEKGRRRDREDSVCSCNDSLAFERNRGPRSLKSKIKNLCDRFHVSSNGNVYPTSTTPLDSHSQTNFITDHKNAKFFVIKSFSEDNVHKSIKYSVWSSTPHGNKKLDAAYHEAKDIEGTCPIFLFFSVNASGQFCGVAEMVGPVDFEKDADYWQQDRWSGQFPVKWLLVKDVPNTRFRHILLENNENKPVTHSRDSQEVWLQHGTEMWEIFKQHEASTSMLDDFEFYDQRERTLVARKARVQAASATITPDLLPDRTINQLSDSFHHNLRLSAVTKEEKTASDAKPIVAHPDVSFP